MSRNLDIRGVSLRKTNIIGQQNEDFNRIIANVSPRRSARIQERTEANTPPSPPRSDSERTKAELFSMKTISATPTPTPSPSPEREASSTEDLWAMIQLLRDENAALRREVEQQRRFTREARETAAHWRSNCIDTRLATSKTLRSSNRRLKTHRLYIDHLQSTNRIIRQANRAKHDIYWTEAAVQDNRKLRAKLKEFDLKGDDDLVDEETGVDLMVTPKRKARKFPVKMDVWEGADQFWPLPKHRTRPDAINRA